MSYVVLWLLSFFVVPPVERQAPEIGRDTRELLEIHRTDRRAHFVTDPNLLFSNTGDGFISVSQGRINRPTVEALKTRFTDVFAGATYAEWDDLEPPIVQVSADGSQAWMIVRLRVRRTKTVAGAAPAQEQFIYAGITTFAKRNGKWVKTANVSTFEGS